MHLLMFLSSPLTGAVYVLQKLMLELTQHIPIFRKPEGSLNRSNMLETPLFLDSGSLYHHGKPKMTKLVFCTVTSYILDVDLI